MHSKQRWPSHQAGEEELGGSDWLTWVCYLPTDTHAHLRPVPLQRVRAQRSRREHDQLRRRPAGGLAPEMGGDQAHKHDDYDGALGTSPPPGPHTTHIPTKRVPRIANEVHTHAEKERPEVPRLEQRFRENVHDPELQYLLPIMQGLLRFLPEDCLSAADAFHLALHPEEFTPKTPLEAGEG